MGSLDGQTLRRLLAQHAQNPEPATIDQIYPRVRPTREGAAADYPRRDLVDRMEVVFAVDYPQYVSEIGDATALAHIGGVADLWPVAMANLRALPAPEHEVIPLVDEEPDKFPLHVFLLRLLLRRLPDPARRRDRRRRSRRRIQQRTRLLVSIPHRHLMLVYVVEDSRTLVGCTRLTSIAQDQFDTSAGAPPACVLSEHQRLTDAGCVSHRRQSGLHEPDC
ncbi:hypothetical protein GS575_11880 [Rhodococcus hoagii]|nr:hypothetical protein [Prescottella equi]